MDQPTTTHVLYEQWRNEALAKDAEIARLKSELAEAKREAVGWFSKQQEAVAAALEAQQARDREHADVLRLESEIAEVCQEDCTLKECWDAVTREMDAHIDARMKIQAERDTANDLLRRALTILGVYADKENWQCNRCKGKDHVNCFMGRWIGPIGGHEEDCGRGDAPCLCDLHGYTIAAQECERISAHLNSQPPYVKPQFHADGDPVDDLSDEVENPQPKEGQ